MHFQNIKTNRHPGTIYHELIDHNISLEISVRDGDTYVTISSTIGGEVCTTFEVYYYINALIELSIKELLTKAIN